MIEIAAYRTNSPRIAPGEFVYNLRKDEACPQETEVTLSGHALATPAEAERADARFQRTNDPTSIMELPGSYNAIICQAGSLSLLADVAGQFPLYYSQDNGTLYYSNSPTVLAEQIGSKAPDRHILAEALFAGRSLRPNGTEYANVNRLSAGDVLRASKHGVSISQYESLAPNPSSSYADVVDMVREGLHEAVKRRLEKSPHLGSDFSGGLDSTSLAFLAAQYLPRGERLDAIFYQHSHAISGDAAHVSAFTELDQRIHIHKLISPGDKLPYDIDKMREVSFNTGLPTMLALRANAQHLILAELEALGVTDHMNGNGADALFTARPFYLADLMRKNSYTNTPRIARDLFPVAQKVYSSPLKVLQFMRSLSRITAAESFDMVVQRLEGTSRRRPVWLELDTGSIELLHMDMRKDLAEIIAERIQTTIVDPEMGIADFLAVQEFWASGEATAQSRELSLDFGIDTHAPYLDYQVAAASLKLSAHLRAQPQRFKPLLSDALQHDVPGAVFQRRSKGTGNHEGHLGFAKHAESIRRLLGPSSMLAELGIIDIEAVQSAIARTEMGIDIASHGLNKAILSEIWLQQNFGDMGNCASANLRSTKSMEPNQASILVQKTPPPEPLQVPASIRIIRDEAATISYNLLTGEVRTMHRKAGAVLEALSHRGNPADALTQLQHMYPAIEPDILAKDLQQIIHGLMEHGTLQPGDFQPFTIARAVKSLDDKLGERINVHSSINRTGLTISDYTRMGHALLTANRLTSSHTLHAIVNRLHETKIDLPYSTPERVERLLRAGHAINHYIGIGACVEYTVGVVLAEARRGRRVDLALGMGSVPRQFHAWPIVEGQHVQTEHDEIIEGNFTPFDIW